MAEADSDTADPSVRGVRIADRITGCISAAAPECANGRALTGAEEVYLSRSSSTNSSLISASQRADARATLIGADNAAEVREFPVACRGRQRSRRVNAQKRRPPTTDPRTSNNSLDTNRGRVFCSAFLSPWMGSRSRLAQIFPGKKSKGIDLHWWRRLWVMEKREKKRTEYWMLLRPRTRSLPVQLKTCARN
jgi:hypothetical protein